MAYCGGMKEDVNYLGYDSSDGNFIVATDANALIIARKDKRERERNRAKVQTMRQDETI